MKNSITLAAVSVALGLALVGCTGNAAETKQPTPVGATPTASATAIPAPSGTSSPEPSVTEEPAANPAPVEAVSSEQQPEIDVPAQEPATDVAASDDLYDGVTTSLAEFLDYGGVCQSGYFAVGQPTAAALEEIRAYCANLYVGDTDGYQRPTADANGYVGPSEEYYSYDGYVQPGFEYQVGSPCFDPALGRCKSSGEVQLENLNR